MTQRSTGWMKIYEILDAGQLNDIEVIVFSECWNAKTYEEIASQYDYDASYLRAVGAALWHKLSLITNTKVRKNNLQVILERHNQIAADPSSVEDELRVVNPNGPLPLDSPYYISRENLDQACLKQILQPGQVLRIRGPRQFGKTSFLLRFLAEIEKNQLTTCFIDFHLADSEVMVSLRNFLKWFCFMVSHQINFEKKTDIWEEAYLGANSVTTEYFEKHLLQEIESPLVLVIDNADVLFQYPQIAQDFYCLLRSWYEQSRLNSDHKQVWKKLRLVLSYSTSDYVMLNIHHSPFNVGLQLELPPLSLGETRQLVERYNLQYVPEDLSLVNHWLGGHPYLMQILLAYIKQERLTWSVLYDSEQNGKALQEIYSKHLGYLLYMLRKKPRLVQVYKEILRANQLIYRYSDEVFQLYSMGLVVLRQTQVKPSCQLYRYYFQSYFESNEGES